MRLRFPRYSRSSLRLLACTLLIVSGGLVTGVAYIFVQQRTTTRTNHAFEELTNGYASHLSQHMERYGDMLYATRALFAATEVNATTWRQFIYTQNAPERYAGMKAVGYAEIVPHQNSAAYLKVLQNTQNKAIRIHPEKPEGDYIILTYDEETDLAGQQQIKALGFDLSSNPARLEAIERAHSTGRVAATGPIHLVTDNHPGFLLILPLMGRAGSADTTTIFGYSIAAFDTANVIDETLGKKLKKDQTSVTITDISGVRPAVLYAKTFDTWNRTVERDIIVQVADRKWQLTFRTPTSSLIMLSDRLAPTVVLAVGIVFILLSCILMHTLKLPKKLPSAT